MREDEHAVRKDLGRRVGSLRRERGLTLRQLASLLDWPQQTLVNYEYGRRPLTVERLVALAHALGCAPATLLASDDGTATVIEKISSNPYLTQQIVKFIIEIGEPYTVLAHPATIKE